MWSLAATRLFYVLGIALGLSATLWAQGLGVSEVVSRMQAAEARVQAVDAGYSATREYQLSAGNSQKPSAQVIAQVNYMPPSQKDFTIQRTEGSDRGAGIIRKVLDHETDVAAHRDRVAITETNYRFALIGQEQLGNRRCYVLQLTPKRESSDLLRGRAWVDAEDFLVRRIQGQPAKSPSWWIKDLNVTLDYGRVEGMWLQLASRAIADVRFAGQHVLTSHAIEIRPASAVATVQSGRPSQNRSVSRRAYTDAGVWVAH